MKIITLIVGLLFIGGAVLASPPANVPMDASDSLGYTIGRLLFGGFGVFIISIPYLFASLIRKLQSKQPDVHDYSALQNAFSSTGSYFSKPAAADDDVVPLATAPSRASILPKQAPTVGAGRLGQQLGYYTPHSTAVHNALIALCTVGVLAMVGYLGWFMTTAEGFEWTTTKIFGWALGGVTLVGVTIGVALWMMLPGDKKTVGLFQRGLAFDDGKKTENVLWEEIEDLYIPFAMRNSTWHVTTYDGRKIKFTGHMKDNEHFIKTLTHNFIGEIVRHKLSRISAGETVKIGFYEVNRGGFGNKKRMFAWNDIASAIFLLIVGRQQSRKLRVNLHGKFFTWTSEEMLAMPSWEIFQQVMQRVAPAHIWSKQSMPWM
jgi:hypothetical protein